MAERDEYVRILHMRDAAQKLVQFFKGRTRADLEIDEMLSLAAARLLEILGEAATHVSPELQAKAPDIPWKLIIGTRNRLIHAYPNVDYDIIWSIVTEDLMPLISNLEMLLGRR